jgi:hypothetical protein
VEQSIESKLPDLVIQPVPHEAGESVDKKTEDELALISQGDSKSLDQKKLCLDTCYSTYSVGMEDNRRARKCFGLWIMILATLYLIVAMLMIIFNWSGSKKVDIVLLSTLPINLLGLVAIVFKFLFSKADGDFLISHNGNNKNPTKD